MASYNLGTLPVNSPITRNNFSVTPTQPTDVFGFRVQGARKLDVSLTDIGFGDDADLRLYRDNGNGIFDAGDR
ncbi:MAG: peptidase, partial [Leptolyngbyaceae cyanobacterium SM1_4_3]|nr:peptidase [Leptolyngbyaceae cyanobacterium SM1_4_3]